jgi:hypothetical protein
MKPKPRYHLGLLFSRRILNGSDKQGLLCALWANQHHLRAAMHRRLALLPKADIGKGACDVRFVPMADITI